MKKLLLVFCYFLFYAQAQANEIYTAQIPDRITYEDKEYSLNSNPLESYFDKNPDLRPNRGIQSTALWRGYIAYFEVIENKLYVVDVKIEVENKDTEKRYDTKLISVYKEIFPNTKRKKVDWYSGILILPHGKLVNYVHLGYGSTYSKYWLLEIENGNLNESRNYGYKDFIEFKKRQFEVFKKTKAYKKLYEDLKKDDSNSEEFIESFLMDFVIEYTKKFLI